MAAAGKAVRGAVIAAAVGALQQGDALGGGDVEMRMVEEIPGRTEEIDPPFAGADLAGQAFEADTFGRQAICDGCNRAVTG